jgi:hypothetical protein
MAIRTGRGREEEQRLAPAGGPGVEHAHAEEAREEQELGRDGLGRRPTAR